MFDALRRLGVPPADSLVYRGFVFVEGEDDVRLFEKGFSNTLQGMKLVQKQGRIEVEKQIQILKAAEAAGKVDKIHLFIFDNDRKPVSHESTKFIRVVQLQRYCIENYLLDDRSLFEFITKSASTPPANRAELTSAIQECSLNQLKVEIAARLYGELQDLSCGMRRSKVRGKSFDQIAATLVEQLQNVKSKLVGLDLVGWNGPREWEGNPRRSAEAVRDQQLSFKSETECNRGNGEKPNEVLERDKFGAGKGSSLAVNPRRLEKI